MPAPIPTPGHSPTRPAITERQRHDYRHDRQGQRHCQRDALRRGLQRRSDSATATATGVAGVNLAADVNLSGTTHTNAGTYTDTWTFTDPSGNYANASGTITDTITKANATVSVTPYDVVYNGACPLCNRHCDRRGGRESRGRRQPERNHPHNAGTYTDTWTFTDPSGNYANATGTVIETISASQGPEEHPRQGATATTTLVNGAGVSVYGQPAAVTVQVTANVPGAAVAAGMVELFVDGAVWTTGTLDSTGQTVISTAGISVGRAFDSGGLHGDRERWRAASRSLSPGG